MPSYIDNIEMADQPSFLQRLGSGLGQFANNRDLALALLANSRGPNAGSFGQAFGASAIQADEMQAKRADDDLMRRYREMQIQQMQTPDQQRMPANVQEYEYAKKNGYQGSFQDWIVAGGQSSRPSAVQEWEFYAKLPPKDQQRYLEMKRNPNFTIKDVNQAPTAITGTPGGGFTAVPLSTTASEAAAAGQIKQAEAQAGAVGAGRGAIQSGIETKGADARQMLNAISMAGGLLDKSTGSWVGSVIDKGAAAFGESTEGAQAAASLKVLQASLLSFVPKMSGPQSDADREIYIAAIGQIGNETVPRETRKAALKTVADMQQKYINAAKQSQTPAAPRSSAPNVIHWDDLK